MLKYFQTFFQTPRFPVGVRVNRLHRGSQDRTDGRVVAQTADGVLVEWPRNGSGWEQPSALCQQG